MVISPSADSSHFVTSQYVSYSVNVRKPTVFVPPSAEMLIVNTTDMSIEKIRIMLAVFFILFFLSLCLDKLKSAPTEADARKTQTSIVAAQIQIDTGFFLIPFWEICIFTEITKTAEKRYHFPAKKRENLPTDYSICIYAANII